MKSIDVRGLSCPEPVIRTRKALQDLPANESLEVLVETVTSRENVKRTVGQLGYRVKVEPIDDGFRLVIDK
ncbi:MAG TPA: sulfurtransferase TusA family protein [bacterium]|nr:sulfurtransferase TusA family protein [bacterium]